MRELTELRDVLTALSLEPKHAGRVPDARRALQAAADARQELVDDIDAVFDTSRQLQDDPPGPMPTIVAVLGPSGAGKSTLINRLVDDGSDGTGVVATGDLRPTTTTPVWVCAPSDRAAMAHISTSDDTVVLAEPVPAGLALVECPDPGVVESAPPSPAADLYLVVVSPARYADAQVWALLAALCDQAASPTVILVLTRFSDVGADADTDPAPMIRDLTRRLADPAVSRTMLVSLPDAPPEQSKPLDALRDNLWSQAGSRPDEDADDVGRQRVEDALTSLIGSLEERLRPILSLESAIDSADAGHHDQTERAVVHQQSAWAIEAWQACRADRRITDLLAEVAVHRTDGRRVGRGLQEVAAEVWRTLPAVLATATRRHTRKMQQWVARRDADADGLEENDRERFGADTGAADLGAVDVGAVDVEAGDLGAADVVTVVSAGRASGHLRSFGSALDTWLEETARDLEARRADAPSAPPVALAALGLVLSTIGSTAADGRGLTGEGTAFLDSLVEEQIAAELLVTSWDQDGETPQPDVVGEDLRQACSHRLGRLLRTATQTFLEQPGSAAGTDAADAVAVDTAGLRRAAAAVSLADPPVVPADMVTP